MPQYVINPTDSTGRTAINLIQPREDGAYPLIDVEVSQRADTKKYVAYAGNQTCDFEILATEGDLEGILPHVRQKRYAVVPPEFTAETGENSNFGLPILAVQKAEGSQELVAVRLSAV